MYGICCVPFLFRKPLVKITFFKSFPKKTLRLWISKIQMWIWSEESTQSVDFMDSWSVFGFAPKNTKSAFGFRIPDSDFPKKTHPKLARKQLCTCSILFCTFLCSFFCTTTTWNVQKLLILVTILMRKMSYVFFFTFFHSLSFSPWIWLVAASISHLSPPLQNFDVVLPSKKCPLSFLSLALYLYRLFSVLIELRWPATYFLFFSVFLLRYIRNFVDMTINLSLIL